MNVAELYQISPVAAWTWKDAVLCAMPQHDIRHTARGRQTVHDMIMLMRARCEQGLTWGSGPELAQLSNAELS